MFLGNCYSGYKINYTTPVAIWPDQVARVNFTLMFDSAHEPFGSNPHLVPTDVTQFYRYGHPDCSGVTGEVYVCLSEPRVGR